MDGRFHSYFGFGDLIDGLYQDLSAHGRCTADVEGPHRQLCTRFANRTLRRNGRPTASPIIDLRYRGPDHDHNKSRKYRCGSQVRGERTRIFAAPLSSTFHHDVSST